MSGLGGKGRRIATTKKEEYQRHHSRKGESGKAYATTGIEKLNGDKDDIGIRAYNR